MVLECFGVGPSTVGVVIFIILSQFLQQTHTCWPVVTCSSVNAMQIFLPIINQHKLANQVTLTKQSALLLSDRVTGKTIRAWSPDRQCQVLLTHELDTFIHSFRSL